MEKLIKRLAWLYLVLLIFEGSLRKWVLPSLAEPLLIVRDPIVLTIYALAFMRGIFPWNGFVITAAVLAVASFLESLIIGQGNLLVVAYGLRINYLHIPLIWVLGRVLDREDVERMGTFILLVAVAMTAIMILQFRSPMHAPINRGVGNDEGGQIFGAAGRIRPPGFFSFITGPQLFFPVAAAFFLHQATTQRRLWFPLFIACGLSILVALPISISRTVMLATAIVGGVFALTLPWARTGGGWGTLRMFFIVGVVGIGVTFLPVFREGLDVFSIRWETAAVSTEGDAWASVGWRIWGAFAQPLYWASTAPIFGYGIGVGSNVGARLLSGRVGFLLVEEEWGKILMELGPLVGTGFIALRFAIGFHLLIRSVRTLMQKGDPLPALLISAVFIPIVHNQWAPPTILGFAIFGGALVLASGNEVEEEEWDEEDEEDEEDDELPEQTGVGALVGPPVATVPTDLSHHASAPPSRS